MSEQSAHAACKSCWFWRSLPLDLYAMSDAVAEAMQGPAVLEDRAFHVLAYSALQQRDDELRREAILGRRTPISWLNHMRHSGILERLENSDDVIDFPSESTVGTARRLVTAIHLDSSMIGALWVSEGDLPFDADSHRTLQEAAAGITATVEHQLALQPRNSAESRLLRALLEQAEADPDAACRALGVPKASLCFVAALETEFGSAAQLDKLIRQVSQCVRDAGLICVTTAIGERVYALLVGASEHATSPRGRARVLELLSRSVGAEVTIGLGTPGAAPGGLARARTEADTTLDYLLRSLDAPRLAYIDDVRTRIAIRELQNFLSSRPLLHSARLRQMGRHDHQFGTAYVSTLSCYFDNLGDIGSTARAMFVHPNSIRYRLRRINELFGIDLTDSDERFLLQVQLYLGHAAETIGTGDVTTEPQ